MTYCGHQGANWNCQSVAITQFIYLFKPDGTPILHQEQPSPESGEEANLDLFNFDYETTEITRHHQITI